MNQTVVNSKFPTLIVSQPSWLFIILVLMSNRRMPPFQYMLSVPPWASLLVYDAFLINSEHCLLFTWLLCHLYECITIAIDYTSHQHTHVVVLKVFVFDIMDLLLVFIVMSVALCLLCLCKNDNVIAGTAIIQF
jgi:hypothetical protein